jgi:hypothetical protein
MLVMGKMTRNMGIHILGLQCCMPIRASFGQAANIDSFNTLTTLSMPTSQHHDNADRVSRH